MIEVFFKEKGFVILELNGESAHNHILYEADSSLSPGTLANVVRIKTRRFAGKELGIPF